MPITFDPNNRQNTLVDNNGIGIYESDDLEEAKKKGRPQDMLDYLQQIRDSQIKNLELLSQLNDKWNEFNLQNQVTETPKRIKP
jgi:hypothetical protein